MQISRNIIWAEVPSLMKYASALGQSVPVWAWVPVGSARRGLARNQRQRPKNSANSEARSWLMLVSFLHPKLEPEFVFDSSAARNQLAETAHAVVGEAFPTSWSGPELNTVPNSSAGLR